MRVDDLGELSGEITVFGGPYSNIQALEALLAVAQGTLICTGDLVAYCGAPNAVIDKVRNRDIHVVAGNCEKQLAARALDCGCGFEDGTTCDLLSAKWYAFANAQVDDASRDWMAKLPDAILFTHSGQRIAVLHGGITDEARFIWSVSQSDDFLEELDALNMLCGDIDMVIAGHSGIAFERDVAGVRWVNAGVIGMPPHDGTSQTEFLRISHEGQIYFEKLTYDVSGAVADMVSAGLTQGYHRALQTGIWPSEDVLPDALRR
ncbi:metallophosphoesterase family protein [Planktotalea sp.]|uniref:metallophosphoesterase family protein n=1 Tax=Planktotalea sp. TaxID=2029877 RepID=UPI0026015FB4|nr:metallophosphoesterase family protein [Planktotalea sp.]